MKLLVLCFTVLFFYNGVAQLLNPAHTFTHQDTLRGSITPERSWWDVLKYDITVMPEYTTKTITGSVAIKFLARGGGNKVMQIDLQSPLVIDSVSFPFQKQNLKFGKIDINAWYVYFENLPNTFSSVLTTTIIVYYHGTPREAVRPPWDGGWIFTSDSLGRPWMTVACQGLGASVWYPCKDHQSDEPDSGANLNITVPDTLMAVGNGRLKNSTDNKDGTKTYSWEVKNPINNYNIVPYIGKYVNFSETYNGEKGKLDINYWVLDYNLERAKRHMPDQVTKTLTCFEYWFGPYPFYEDGYKLVEAPHLGMEHQSAIAYGNKYKMGYRGFDLSGTGWGLKWDFIIVHESGHEWFGNNITAKDIADMWIHESFTSYAETLFTEYWHGKKAGNKYIKGTRMQISNDVPVIGSYGVNQEGSRDMYYKGANMLHVIRQRINNDSLFRSVLRGLNKTFYHQTVTTQQIEDYISKESGIDFSNIFDEYLRTTEMTKLPGALPPG
jgi:aminopeptidase N